MGRKLEKRKEQITHFGVGEVKHEKENTDSDASGKRKSSEMEADGQMSAEMPNSIIETNQQFGAGRVEPEKEKNPPQENEGLLVQNQEKDSHQVEPEKEKNPPQENEGLLVQNQEKDSHQVEPEKEKNPQQENEGLIVQNQENDGKEVVEYVDKSAFKGTLFSRQYIHRGSNDILQVGQQYKSKIKETVQEHINRGIRFYIVYEVELEKYGDGEEDDYKMVHLHSANRRILDMYEFDDVYEQAMTKINDQFEVWMGEGSGWVMDRINSISLNIARMKY